MLYESLSRPPWLCERQDNLSYKDKFSRTSTTFMTCPLSGTLFLRVKKNVIGSWFEKQEKKYVKG